MILTLNFVLGQKYIYISDGLKQEYIEQKLQAINQSIKKPKNKLYD